jgi:hypothetical protein
MRGGFPGGKSSETKSIGLIDDSIRCSQRDGTGLEAWWWVFGMMFAPGMRFRC